MGRMAQSPVWPFLTSKQGSALIRLISGAPARERVMLLRPGQKDARPYRLDPMKYAGAPGLVGLPAFERVLERAARSHA